MPAVDIEQLILERTSLLSVDQYVESRTRQFFGLDPNVALPRNRLIRAYCIANAPYDVLNELLNRSQLDAIAAELGVANSAHTGRNELINAIIERGLGFRPVQLAGSSNNYRKLQTYARQMTSASASSRHRRVGELVGAGVQTAAIVEQTIKSIFALHLQLLFGFLEQEEQLRIRNIANSRRPFKVIVDKLRQIDKRVIPANPMLRDVLDRNFGRAWIVRDSTLESAVGVFDLRSTQLAHEERSLSWHEAQPIVMRIIDYGLSFLDDVCNDKLLPAMIMQLQSSIDQWERIRIYYLTEEHFDEDGRLLSEPHLDDCFVMDGRGVPFRPRTPCYCIPDDFSLQVVYDTQLFFVDELWTFPEEMEVADA